MEIETRMQMASSAMRDILLWRTRGKTFQDGSNLIDWRKIEASPWQWQYDTHELAFDIYEYAGEYWKLYRIRFVPPNGIEYEYDFGGQACRMTQVEYISRARSPHSNRLMHEGDLEWVRTNEVDELIHTAVRPRQESLNFDIEETRS